MTFFGAFLRRLGGWIAVADLVALMGDLGLDPQAVRSAVSRLKRRGVIAPQRRGGAAGAALPADWPGAHAWEVFRALDRRLSRPALRHVEARVSRPSRAGSAPSARRTRP